MELILTKIENVVWGIPLIVLLMSTHIYFTIKLKAPQKYVFCGLKMLLNEDKSKENEGISSFKAMMSVLAATLGTGNIIGVASAIIIGGIGSIFWMFVSGVLAIATKYAETYIVLKYRKKNKSGKFGGTMYVLDERIGNKKAAVLFSILLVITTIGMGALIQSNAISATISSNFNIDVRIVAIFVTFLCGYVILGNEKKVADVSSILVPIAVGMYLVTCCILLVLFRNNIINSIINIIKEAFSLKATLGGFLSSRMVLSMSSGLSKGLFTNESGMGTSPIFDVTVKEENMTKQSIISSTTVFIDTVLLCTITGIIFVSSNMYQYFQNPIELSQQIFSTIPYGRLLYIFSIIVFAIATIPCSAYYGSIGIKYLFSSKKIYILIYKTIYILFIYIGTTMQVKEVWSISSIANALLVIPNIYMLFYLRKEIVLDKEKINIKKNKNKRICM